MKNKINGELIHWNLKEPTKEQWDMMKDHALKFKENKNKIIIEDKEKIKQNILNKFSGNIKNKRYTGGESNG